MRSWVGVVANAVIRGSDANVSTVVSNAVVPISSSNLIVTMVVAHAVPPSSNIIVTMVVAGDVVFFPVENFEQCTRPTDQTTRRGKRFFRLLLSLRVPLLWREFTLLNAVIVLGEEGGGGGVLLVLLLDVVQVLLPALFVFSPPRYYRSIVASASQSSVPLYRSGSVCHSSYRIKILIC